ncbi:MAG: hypothetical protein HZB50_16585 [Chloroflexi bacterium]|nr:hypothetical protein [Chloroflexota bacterium]
MMRYFLYFLVGLILLSFACGGVTTTPLAPVASAATPKNLSTLEANVLWYKTLGDSKADQAWGVDTDSRGNVYVAAFEQTPGQFFTDMVIYKFTVDGEQVWRTPWGGEFQEKAFVLSVAEPYIYVGGLTHTAVGLTKADMAVLAIDMESGEVLWIFTWGQDAGEYEEVDGLVVDGDFIYISGWTTSENNNYDIAVLKLDRQGNLIWKKVWSNPGFDTADGQIVVDDSYIYISGRLNGTNMFSGGQTMLAKFSKESGEYAAHSTWGNSFLSDGLGMTSDGEALYVVGMDIRAGKGSRIFLLKYDKELNLLWQSFWGDDAGEHTARAVAVNGAGNIFIGGNTRQKDGGPNDIALIEFGTDGELRSTNIWGGPADDSVQGLVIDGDYAYIVGLTKSYGQGDSDALLIKMTAP